MALIVLWLFFVLYLYSVQGRDIRDAFSRDPLFARADRESEEKIPGPLSRGPPG